MANGKVDVVDTIGRRLIFDRSRATHHNITHHTSLQTSAKFRFRIFEALEVVHGNAHLIYVPSFLANRLVLLESFEG
jgi:hypothetical protein